MDAIHANVDTASAKVVEEARALRDKLRDGKHVAAAEPASSAAALAEWRWNRLQGAASKGAVVTD
eukprot:scaffold22711_cov57-Phaeocystis_antarctica.AAC.2